MSVDHPAALLVALSSGSTVDRAAFESLLQALALPSPRGLGRSWSHQQSLFALELVGSAQSQALVVRAANERMLQHLATQLQARFPGARILPMPADRDPLALRSGEAVTVYELRRAGAEPYLSLRTGEPRERMSGRGTLEGAGADPLLGLLAALSTLPAPARAVLQLALAPAPEDWSRGYLQAADRYSLYRARDDSRLQRQEKLQRELRELPGWYVTSAPLSLVLAALIVAALWRLAAGARSSSLSPHSLMRLVQLVAAHRSPAPPDWSRLPPLVLGGGAALLLLLWATRAAIRALERPSPLYDTDLVARKTERLAYRAVVRLYAMSPAGGEAGEARRAWRSLREQALDQAAAAYRQFHAAGAGYFATRHLSSWQARRLLPRWRLAGGGRCGTAVESAGGMRYSARATLGVRSRWTRGVRRSSHFLTVAEIAGLWHVPEEVDLIQAPFLRDIAAWQSRLAPRAVAHYPAATQSHLTGLPGPGAAAIPLGISYHGGHRAEVTLSSDVLARHTLAIGGTGKGKSSLLLALARSWLELPLTPGESKPALALFDPHGDLASALLQTLPAGRLDDVLVVDLADTEYPIGLNPLDVTPGRGRDKVCEDLIAIFAHIWESSWGYRMEDIWKVALKTLFEANQTLAGREPDHQYTLVDVPALLTNKAFRRMVLAQIRDPELVQWWQRFATWDMRLQHDATLPVLNKVGNFGGSKVARRLLGQSRSTVDLAAALRSGRIMVVHTAPRIVGPDTSALVGATLLGLLQWALGDQAQLQRAERRRALVVIDEFQAIPGADYAGMLGELRKFGGVFVLATQSLAHLDRLGATLRATVLGNVGNLFAFGMSAEDAHKIALELDGTITEQDLINLEDFTCYARLTHAGQRLRTFSLALAPPPTGSAAQEERLRSASRAAVGRPREVVEAQLAQAMRRRLFPGPPVPGSGPPATQLSPGDHQPLPEEEPESWQDADIGTLATGSAPQSTSAKPRYPRRRSTAAERWGREPDQR